MTKRRRGWLIFTICLLLYAIVFLVALGFGLDWLWGYMASYEASRPNHTVESYMENLTPAYICDKSADLIAKADSSVQSPEQCRQVITEALSGKFTHIKNLGESTDDKTVYLIRCGSRIIGRFEMAQTGTNEHGFPLWKVTSDSFDLSYLLTSGHTVTVPDTYRVTVNGAELNDAHITVSGIRFPLLQEFYDAYTLPTLVTYETGATLGETEMVVTDPAGIPIIIDEAASYDSLLPFCADGDAQRLEDAVAGFIQDYVDFTSCTNNDVHGNHDRLQEHILPGSALAKRMTDAITGLKWVSDRGAKVAGIDIASLVDIGGGKYLCDVVYRVDTRNITGSVQTESHVKMIFTETDDGLKAETMLTR